MHSTEEPDVKNLCWTLIGLAGLAFGMGTVLSFAGHKELLLWPEGYWRGSIGLLLFAIALRLMSEQRG
ncbi:MAG: hypothetical protein H6Q08_906 [Acidobacteria bacterium]|jgi:hypothetical protein|nr:hypothetical protein [Acidobacteriota bacterium]